MINKRIIHQLEEIKQFPQALLIIENYNLEYLNNTSLNQNALRGLILSINLKYQIPIIFTKNEGETAQYIKLISMKKEKEVSLNYSKKTLSKKEQLQFILEAFPKIGPTKAKKLLEEFRSLKKTFNSSEEELKKILGNQAKEFLEIIERGYWFISPKENTHKPKPIKNNGIPIKLEAHVVKSAITFPVMLEERNNKEPKIEIPPKTFKSVSRGFFTSSFPGLSFKNFCNLEWYLSLVLASKSVRFLEFS